jgi:hypothetical protein
MQNNGVVNDHIHGFLAEDYIQPHTTWERGARWSAFRSWSTVLPWAGCSKLSRSGQLEADKPHTPCRCTRRSGRRPVDARPGQRSQTACDQQSAGAFYAGGAYRFSCFIASTSCGSSDWRRPAKPAFSSG